MRYTHLQTFLLVIISIITTNVLSAQFSQAEQYFRSGKTLQEKNDLNNALDYYNLAIQENQTHLNALFSRSQVRYKLGHLKTAIYDLDNFLLINPYDATALELRGLIHFDQGNFKRALADFENSLSYHRSAQGFINVGIVQKAMEQYGEALESFSSAIQIQRNLSAAHCGKGDTYVAMGEKYYPKALQNYAVALTHNPLDLFTLKNRGKLYLAIGNFENAVDDFEKAISIKSDYESYLHLAQCRLEQRQWKKAEDLLMDRALKMNQNDPEIYFTLGLIEKAMGKHDDALESFKVAADYNSQNPHYQLEIGFAEYHLGNPYGAIHAFNEYRNISGEENPAIETMITNCYDMIEIESQNQEQIATEKKEIQEKGIPIRYFKPVVKEKKMEFTDDVFEK